jgi:phosphoribosylaminoimidazole carboxylase PurE protein
MAVLLSSFKNRTITLIINEDTRREFIMAKPVVGILMGSDSDLPIMQEAAAMLQEFGIEYEMTIASAHRTPKKVLEYSQSAEKRGLKVIIAGAGWAAHLAGFVASQTTLPVIGVPIDSSPLKGIDALLSVVQMPGGVPVATMSLGKPGAKNAGVFAAQIIGIGDVKIANRLKVYKVEMERDVEEKSKRLVAISAVVTPLRETPHAEPGAAPAKKKPRRRRWKKKPGGTAPVQEPAS